MKIISLALLFTATATAREYVGNCDYIPIGLDAPARNCDWLSNGGLDACNALESNCAAKCGRNPNEAFEMTTANDDGGSTCQCICKLK
ncbi:hypothetical protein CKM354_000449000 [Cercospora kikuchii]|uniref:Uncharacterized protein n=1 Tax=Cercospora kikuchii TaxID=84275 RepID=A0A9P3FG73_9PEZI|nr:uncharacterized protein CKM354_000449000 [Cercospora kikuchii]GIZ41175.1 hypothetical protein CKM354_000449000 [Cercospora kikuchii]